MNLQARFPGGVWLLDTEFHPTNGVEGNLPHVVCLVAREHFSGRTFQLWQDELAQLDAPPFPIDDTALVVCFYASADVGAFLALGWRPPVNLLDLFVAFRTATNGRRLIHGTSLIGALAFFDVGSIGAAKKDLNRDLVMRRGPWTMRERDQILEYCLSDTVVLGPLLDKMASFIDWPRTLLHSNFSTAAAHIEHSGVPIDLPTYKALLANWTPMQLQLITEIDKHYGVFEGAAFRRAKFEAYLMRWGIAWPRLTSGQLDLADDTFKSMAQAHPQLAMLRELRTYLSQMRALKLAVGEDGRNRCLLSIFRATTGRCQPSTTRFIFGPSTWLRGLIKPKEGYGVAYIDWSQQEFGIAAALSGDQNMMDAYRSGDPYLSFAKQAGAVPSDATKRSHPGERELFKQCILATQYGMAAESLATRINKPRAYATELLRQHRRTYSVFWSWSERVVNHGLLSGQLWTVFGWRLRVGSEPNVRSLQNFPMQANGAEMLRLACLSLSSSGIRVVAPVHDALLIEAPLSELDDAVARTQAIMKAASAAVLNGFELNSDAKIVRYPDRYMDPRGVGMWNTVMGLLGLTDRAVSDV